jgi:hypothetical protein
MKRVAVLLFGGGHVSFVTSPREARRRDAAGRAEPVAARAPGRSRMRAVA